MQKTNVTTVNKFERNNYPVHGGNLFHNTDEHGMEEVIFFIENGGIHVVAAYMFEELTAEILKDEFINKKTDYIERTSEPIEITSEEGKVSESFALEMLKIVVNKD